MAQDVSTESSVNERVASPVARVAVTGDVTVDWNIARTRSLVGGGTAWTAEDSVETYPGPGGAAILARLIGEVGAAVTADCGLNVEVSGPSVDLDSISPGDSAYHHAFDRRLLW